MSKYVVLINFEVVEQLKEGETKMIYETMQLTGKTGLAIETDKGADEALKQFLAKLQS